ncbi:MAG: ATP-binding cassette domain-containing protein [Nitrospirota bacterium]|nr:ATP-binding cassette domain-containing protein [Nitrospirota bacterium]MDH5586006.1 ATP-binding cassette domain-containing protein [Nitrospirota bacterium]MDH5776006.1 ATP-binding cassette domain-containing protein [Nitrospirota bacterium]
MMRDLQEEHLGESLVEIRHATVYREMQCVLKDLSLCIPLGCSTVILGPNGSGKSTFMKLLTRELYPVAKETAAIRLLGRETWNVWDLRRQLGMVSADLHHDYLGETPGLEVVLSAFFSSISLYDHHAISHYQRAKSYEVMDRLGVASLQDQPFAHMSTGEQRRILLARALVHEPRILILDEPTTGLDVSACFQYLEILRQFIREGGTVILVTHHLHEIPPEIDRVVLLNDGHIQADGPKREVLNAPSLSALFGTPVELLQRYGWFQVVPAASVS